MGCAGPALTTVPELAALKDFVPAGADAPHRTRSSPAAMRRSSRSRRRGRSGQRLDELVHRAKSFRRSVLKDGTQALGYIPGKGNSTLPVSTPELNANLVWLYLDAQLDYLEGRRAAYLLGGLVVACKDGKPVARRSVVKIS